MSRQGDPSLTFVERHADSIARLALIIDAAFLGAVVVIAALEERVPGPAVLQAAVVVVLALATNRALDYRNSARRSRELAMAVSGIRYLTRRVDELSETLTKDIDQLGRREQHENSDRDRDLQVAALVDRLEQIERRLPDVDTAYELGRMVGHDERKNGDES